MDADGRRWTRIRKQEAPHQFKFRESRGGLRKVDVYPDFRDLADRAALRTFVFRKAATSSPFLNGP
jgi:hypothetical protein